jgi:hypothetical protein
MFPASSRLLGGASSSSPAGEARVNISPSFRSMAVPRMGCAPNVSVKGFVYPNLSVVPPATYTTAFHYTKSAALTPDQRQE